MGTTLGILSLVRMIHSIAEENSSKKGGRPKTEWEDHIEEIEHPPPPHFIPRSSQSEGWTGTLRNANFISSFDMKHAGPRS